MGTKSHGTVCGVQNYGVFVAFYGDVKGLVHASELGLEPGESPEAAYHIGQVRTHCTFLHQLVRKGCPPSLLSDLSQ